VKFLTTLRSERLFAEIKASGDPTQPRCRKAIERLVGLGANAIPGILEALEDAERTETAAYVEALKEMTDAKTLPLVLQGLASGHPNTVAAVTKALVAGQNYPPTQLLTALKDRSLSSAALLEAISAHQRRLPIRDLLAAAYLNEVSDKRALFKIIEHVAGPDSIPELLARLSGKDVTIRSQLIDILARFETTDVQHALLAQLQDPSRLVRQAALRALLRQGPLGDVRTIVPLLADADMEVANRAVELLIRARHPDTVPLLVPVLQDESEYARRAAVEVLNEVGDATSIKHLLAAIKDSDWWVRSRAADALGKIGGPKVVDAVLELVQDADEDIRRTAIEILNLTKDDRAIDFLITATEDKDWWVSERAVDALASMGALRALPRLREMLEANEKSLPTLIRAVGHLGGVDLVPELAPFARRAEREVALEAIKTLSELAGGAHDALILDTLKQVSATATDENIATSAGAALRELEGRLVDTGATTRLTALGRSAIDDSANVRALLARRKQTVQRLDISTLRPGDVLENRYRFIEKIGKGAFGTVLLVQDKVVDEQLVLKFLNPGVGEDEEVMQRFVHELRYSRKITHPNVIRIYDFLHIRGNYAISMEYFKSHTLAAEIARGTPIPLQTAIRYGLDIANGMSAAHDVGIVHRDLKPANVLINDESLVKIVDFGVSAAIWERDSHLTRTGYVIGSPKYMAPEQILGKDTDMRADIYSTGVMLYEMLTGQPPYSKGDHMAVMYQHVQGKAPLPKELRPELPDGLSEIVMKAMSVDRELRYKHMQELKAALEPFAG
jgi:eukaryotic-like serine/threonine-protein kinase